MGEAWKCEWELLSAACVRLPLLQDALQFAQPGARLVSVGKRGGQASTPQAEINALLVHECLQVMMPGLQQQPGKRRHYATSARRSGFWAEHLAPLLDVPHACPA